MNEQFVKNLLRTVGAIITGSHFVYTSGKHGSAFVNPDALYPHTRETSRLCLEMAEHFSCDGVDVVIAPAVGGVILSQWVAYHLTKTMGREVLGVYADKADDGNFVIKRGYDKLVAGKNVMVVEDVTTTGQSVRKVVEAVRAIGGNVTGVGVLCNRGGITAADVADVPKFFELVYLDMGAWDEEFCPFCKRGVPIRTDVGKGREYLANKNLAGKKTA